MSLGRKGLLYALIPLVALAVLLFAIQRYGASGFGFSEVPPIEELTFEWTTLKPGEIKLDVVNSGPDEVTIAQVMVDEAYWRFSMSPSNTLGRLEHGTVTIPYPWVEGDAYEVVLLSKTGVTFATEIEVAVPSPVPGWRSFGTFAMLGVLIGVVPVALGLMWYPVARALSDQWMRFLLALTVGLLTFLGLDTIEEGLEIAEALPGAYQGTMLLFGVGMLVFFALVALGSGRATWSKRLSPEVMLALMVALGIGLHNVGEGLAVGSAYVLGNVAVGTSLVLGFTLHNVTEGLAIIAPAAKKGLSLRQLVLFGALAGVPTIAGTLIGGFTYSNLWALVFFAVAAGAIFQVVFAIAKSPGMRSEGGELASAENFLGFLCGLAIMYGTGLLVAA